MIKTSFSYFIYCSNVQKLHLHAHTIRKNVLIIFASLKKNPETVFQYRILKHQYEENTKYSIVLSI